MSDDFQEFQAQREQPITKLRARQDLRRRAIDLLGDAGKHFDIEAKLLMTCNPDGFLRRVGNP